MEKDMLKRVLSFLIKFVVRFFEFCIVVTGAYVIRLCIANLSSGNDTWVNTVVLAGFIFLYVLIIFLEIKTRKKKVKKAEEQRMREADEKGIIFCPECGGSMNKTDKFCPKCHHKM